MEFSFEWIFFLVFFVPIGVLVTINLLLHGALPDLAAPWVRLAAPAVEPEPVTPNEAPVPLPARETEVSNDEEAREAA